MPYISNKTPAVVFHGSIPEYKTSDQALIEDLERARVDSAYFSKIFLPETFYNEDDAQKTQAWELLDDDTLPWVAIEGRRTMGKTSMFHGRAAAKICLRQMPFLLWLGKTFQRSSEETEILKTYLMESPSIRDIFGNMVFQTFEDGTNRKRTSTGRATWVVRDPINGAPFSQIVPLGARQSPRGIGALIGLKRRRVSDIMADDIDDEKGSDTMRFENLRWLHGPVAKTVHTDLQPEMVGCNANRWTKSGASDWRAPWRIYVFGNYIAPDSVIQHCLEDPRYRSLRLPLATKRGDGLYYSEVPEIFTDQQIRRRIEYEQQNPSLWVEFCHDELLSEPENTGKDYWGDKPFQYYIDRSEPSLTNDPGLIRFLIGDPSRSYTHNNDPSGIVVAALDQRSGKIYLRDYIQLEGDQAGPTPFTKELIRIAKQTNSWWWAIEFRGGDEWIREGIQTKLDIEGLRHKVRFIELNTSASSTGMPGDFGSGPLSIKKRRAASAAALYEPLEPTHPHGHVFHAPKLRGSSLEMAMKKCPANTVWCGLDCVGYISQIQMEKGWFFSDQTPRTHNEIKNRMAEREAKRRWLEQCMAANY